MKGFKWVLVETYDKEAMNECEHVFQFPLRVDEEFTIDDVTYIVDHAEWYADKQFGKAMVRMTRYRIPDTATQFVHKCPAMEKHMSKLSHDDLMKFEAKLGEKTVEGLKKGRVKMRHHKTLEQKCKHCGVVFWKKKNVLPEQVDVDVEMNVDSADDEYFDFDGEDFIPIEKPE